MRHSTLLLLSASLLGCTSLGFAQAITNLGLYAGGEQDSSPFNGGTPSAGVDGSGNNNTLTNFGATWSTAVSPGSAGFDRGAASTFSYYFDGSDRMTINTPLTTVTTNWGIETWVRLDDTVGTQVFMVNGTGADGYGLILTGGNWSGLLGGVIILDAGPAVSNTWTHLALVSFGDINSVGVYVNGVLEAFSPTGVVAPSSQFSLGSDTSNNFMRGFLDQSRLFTYTGNFSPAVLNLSSVPEPASFAALTGFFALGFCALRRRRRA